MTNITDLARFNDVSLQSSTPFESLYRVDPSMVTTAYARRNRLLTPQFLPYVEGYRDLEPNERVALTRALVEMHRMKSSGEVARFETDGKVRMVHTHETNETGRVKIRETNETARTNTTQRGLTVRTELSEQGLTRRKQIELQGSLALQKIEYEARVQMVKDHIDGQKYLSDNRLKAVYAEAEAFRYAIETRERLRADVEKSVSRDRLEERVKVATAEFAAKIKQAETHRGILQDRNLMEMASQYLQNRTQLYLDALRMETELGIADRKLEERRLELMADSQKSMQETVRQGIDVIRTAISNGKGRANLVIEVGSERIVLDYSSEDD
ncbi:MAG: hypothetical protein Q8P81_00255 [Nanoarchaeota archaeon]|nr:hypothetical protein [Nanoarchaeota archaeon]